MFALKDVKKNLYYTSGRYVNQFSKGDGDWNPDINCAKTYKTSVHAQRAAKNHVDPGYGKQKRTIDVVKIVFEPGESVATVDKNSV